VIPRPLVPVHHLVSEVGIVLFFLTSKHHQFRFQQKGSTKAKQTSVVFFKALKKPLGPQHLRRGVVEHHYTLPCDGPPKILHVTSFEKKRSNHAVLCCPGENWPVSKGMKKHRPWK